MEDEIATHILGALAALLFCSGLGALALADVRAIVVAADNVVGKAALLAVVAALPPLDGLLAGVLADAVAAVLADMVGVGQPLAERVGGALVLADGGGACTLADVVAAHVAADDGKIHAFIETLIPALPPLDGLLTGVLADAVAAVLADMVGVGQPLPFRPRRTLGLHYGRIAGALADALAPLISVEEVEIFSFVQALVAALPPLEWLLAGELAHALAATGGSVVNIAKTIALGECRALLFGHRRLAAAFADLGVLRRGGVVGGWG